MTNSRLHAANKRMGSEKQFPNAEAFFGEISDHAAINILGPRIRAQEL